MKLIAGLGNPGEDYRDTRHNIGFLVIDHLASFYKIPLKRNRFQAIWGKGVIAEKEVLLIKPQTYMNLSGQSVGGFKDFYKLSNQDILIIYDDLDLPFGKLRIRTGGGTGGHRGMVSVAETLGSEDFPRLRMGIGRPLGNAKFKRQNSKLLVVDYILSSFGALERDILEDFLEAGRKAIETMLTEGIDEAMNRFN